jgi:UDP-N-acetylglucosamine acyltransferase
MVNNEIHPSVIIEGDVKIGKGNKIYPNTIIYGPTEIGNNNIIGPNVVIGMFGQDTRNPRYDASNAFIKIGNNNIIREFTSIQKPCYKEITELGNDIYLMQSVHIPHDAILEDKVVITPMCVLAGITRIMEGANLGMGCTINQYNVIGQYSIVATGAATMKNVKPFSRYIPGKELSVNDYAIKKYGYEDFREEIVQYVLNDKKPTSSIIQSIVEKFEKFHIESKRFIY